MQLVPPPGPTRLLAGATFVNTFGNGLFYTGSVLFFTRSVGLSPGQVGFGLTLAGALGLLAGIPFGHLADRRGAREVLVTLMVAEGFAMAALALVHSFGAFLLVACTYTVLDRGANGVRQGLIASAFPPAERVRGRAYLRSVTNLGIALGAAFAGVALQVDTRAAYVALVLGDAVTYLLAALVLLRLPRSIRAEHPPEGGMLLALRDRPFLVVTVLNGVVGMHYVLLEVAVPLWVTRHTDAPRWTVALLFLINTACCVLFQVRAARSSVDVPSSARAVRNGSALLALSCLVFAASGGRSAGIAIAVLIAAALVNVTGELMQASGSWGLGFGLAPESGQGQYQGLYSTGFAAASMLGPLVVTLTAIRYGTAGWVALGVLFAAAGAATVPAAAWAERSRRVLAPAG
ncbi:MAG: major facilitator superfamily 1 [Frankiales bacterium]|nr:major facilitator superfamily 1 [Frankiales bacterium]